jgi:hypothetical protein
MKIIYTDSAKEELKKFHKRQQEKLENIIQQEKYVFGDDVIEITASDIYQAERFFIIIEERSSYRLASTLLLFKIYLIIGLAMTFLGLFYKQLLLLFKSSPPQFIIVIMGFLFTLSSLFMIYLIKVKIEKRKRYERMIIKDQIEEDRQ